MTANQDIHAFAVKWLDVFRDTETATHVFEESAFADACVAHGFETDCGKAFEAAYPESKAFDDCRILDGIVDSIDSVPLLGSAILSRWRYLTHGAGSGEDILSFENRAWFITAFSRLERLLADAETTPAPFESNIMSVEIVSNSMRYGPRPAPDDEVEQHLSITSDGRVCFAVYTYGDGIKHNKSRTKEFTTRQTGLCIF